MSEDYELILAFLEMKIKSKVRLVSLKTLCARKVAESLPTYAQLKLTKLSSVLPKPLCSIVSQEFLQSCQDNPNLEEEWRACDVKDKLNLFVGSGLEEFDCSLLNLRWKPTDGYQKPFEQFAKESSKLRSLKDHRNYTSLKNSRIQLLSEYYSLDTIPSLVVLEIKDYPVHDADLQVIGLSLPLLQRLMLFAPRDWGELSSNISFQALEYLKNLTFLKHLSFRVDDDEYEESVQLVKSCLQLMPKVNTVGASFEEGRFYVKHEIPSYEQVPVEMGLEHFVLGKYSVIPSNVTLPNVTKVTVLDNLPISLLQFKKLRQHLSYNNSDNDDWSQLEQTLTDVGHLLKTLHLSLKLSYHLVQVLQLCPNLEEIILHEVMFEDNFQAYQLNNCVQNLKIFKHKFEVFTDTISFESYGLLHLLLSSCPQLEELKINAIRLSKRELKSINRKMTAGALTIQKLQKVKISAVFAEGTLSSYTQFARMLCIVNCRILKKVSITESIKREIIPLEMKVALRMQEYINNQHTFRSD